MRAHGYLARVLQSWRNADWHPLCLYNAWGGWLTASVVLLLLFRIYMMLCLPVTSAIETHDSELARHTLETGSWLLPHFSGDGAPTPGPPLAAWLGALSMAVFGETAFAARLPAALACIAMAYIAAQFAAAVGMRSRSLVVPVLVAFPLFFVSTAAAASPAVQSLIAFAAHYCGWRALMAENRAEGYNWRGGFWALVGLGALTNGLATCASIVLPIAAYLAYRREVLAGLWRLSDMRSLFLGLMLCMPWYMEAERAYPGFLRACLIDRHIAGPWATGELQAHPPWLPGMIWIYWLAAVLPWVGIFRAATAAALRGRSIPDPASEYLYWMMLTPLLYLAVGRDLSWGDALPAVLPFAVFVARWLDTCSAARRQQIGIVLAAWTGALCVAGPWLVRHAS